MTSAGRRDRPFPAEVPDKMPRARIQGRGLPRVRPNYFVVGMHIIIGMPPDIIIIGAPMAIMLFMASQRSFMRDIIEVSVGVIFMTMPSFVISHDILHIIGI